MILRRIAALALALALLAGWQESLQHPLEHVDEHGGFVHKSGDHHDSSNADGPLCDAIAAIAVAVGCAAAPEFAAAAEAPSRARPNTPLAPSSRDPPQRL